MQIKMALAVLIAGLALAGCEKKADSAAATDEAAAAAKDEAAPAAEGEGSSGACDKYQKCCDAVSKLPNMSALTQACANIPQLKEAPGGEDACKQAVSAMAQSLAALPDGAPEECK
ncbi:MAG: hypothetical protein JW841_06105 [Deltaproteobacteria bacterium]|nr:hypothetical protein [Deltaproteobacteria bacterium]